ncbi:MAG: c-type cytochrome [Gemmatimonadetes bacterium]|nr:c-type cytochrome [Gemmatimonadota bacterium]
MSRTSRVPRSPGGVGTTEEGRVPTMRSLALLTFATALACASLVAQDLPETNPFHGDSAAVLAGMGQFRQRCADCHGMDARGVRAPDLTQVWSSGRTDRGLFNTVRNGVSNTEMPAFTAPRTSDRDVWQILAYLRTLASPAPTDLPTGDVGNGALVFENNCSGCHRVNAKGGLLGPELSRIGSGRSREVLLSRIRTGIDEPRPGFQPVTITPESGPPIRGVKKNEDLFSVQIMDTRERIQGYRKDQVRSVVDIRRSMMPIFGPERLSDSDLTDLVRYLGTLRGFDPSVEQRPPVVF